jgi:hypothetical protein
MCFTLAKTVKELALVSLKIKNCYGLQNNCHSLLVGGEEARKFVLIGWCSPRSNTCTYRSAADSVHVTIGGLRILLVGDHFLLQAN